MSYKKLKTYAAKLSSGLILCISTLNSILAAFGQPIIQANEDTLNYSILLILTLLSVAYRIWKNCNVTPASKMAQLYLDALKQGNMIKLSHVHAFVLQQLKKDVP